MKCSINLEKLNETRSHSEATEALQLLESNYAGSSYYEGSLLFMRELWKEDSSSHSLKEAVAILKDKKNKDPFEYDGACIFVSYLWSVKLSILQNSAK